MWRSVEASDPATRLTGVIVRCTAKVVSLLGVAGGALVDAVAADDDWYLNLFWIERRKCLLLTHAGSLFSLFLGDVRASDLRPIGPVLVDAIAAELRAEGLARDVLGALDPEGVRLAKTASRSVLGFMNEMVFEIRYGVARQGGLGRVDARAVNYDLQRTLRNRGGYVYPIDLVRERGR
jgi:hypothetical protein